MCIYIYIVYYKCREAIRTIMLHSYSRSRCNMQVVLHYTIIISVNVSLVYDLFISISPFLLRYTSQSIAQPLCRLFNYSLTTGVFPTKWKRSHVTPVHTNGNKQLVSNYRPISLLSCVSKMLERMVYKTIYEYCTDNNLLTAKNSGFTRNDSTINQLLYLVQQIYDSLDNAKDSCMVFLDVSKAFDRVWYDGVLFKLQQMGISGSLLSWI
jgi:hypothetical protein